MAIVICECGAWLKAPERDRVAAAAGPPRCPNCGRAAGVGPGEDSAFVPSARGGGKWSRPRAPLRGRPLPLGEALAYPLADGPGIALLVVFPPFLTIMSVPVFEIVTLFRSGPRGDFNPLAFLIVPFSLPMVISFTLTFGYVLLYLGRVLVSSAVGERDHPRYPIWERFTILEGVGRWIWAGLLGFGVGALPAIAYWKNCGDVDWLDLVVFAELLALGAGYAQMALAAALLHDSLAMANPITVARAIWSIGWAYLYPSLVAAVAVMLGAAAWTLVMYYPPGLGTAALGLWGFWVFALYEAMVVLRVVGWCYYRHGQAIGWFRTRPSWGAWERPGRIYSNS